MSGRSPKTLVRGGNPPAPRPHRLLDLPERRGESGLRQSQPGSRATLLHGDEAAAWNVLHVRFSMRHVNHQDCHHRADDGAPGPFSAASAGPWPDTIIHHLSGPYLNRYAQKMACQLGSPHSGRSEIVKSKASPRRIAEKHLRSPICHLEKAKWDDSVRAANLAP
jgi:hypothetical protein